MSRSYPRVLGVAGALCLCSAALAQSNINPSHKYAWAENCGWLNWRDAGTPTGAQGAHVAIGAGFLSGFVWGENIGWINLGNGGPYANTSGVNFGVNLDTATGDLTGYAWGENVGWINFSGGALATPAQPARLDAASARLRGYAWGENTGWINLDDATSYVGVQSLCGSVDFNCDGDLGTDSDIAAFFACLSGSCPPPPCTSSADFNGDGDLGTDADIEAFFRVLAGGHC